MRTKIFGGIALVAIAVTLATSFNIDNNQINNNSLIASANAKELMKDDEINPSCPNGCVTGSGGCYCNGYYPEYKEYKW